MLLGRAYLVGHGIDTSVRSKLRQAQSLDAGAPMIRTGMSEGGGGACGLGEGGELLLRSAHSEMPGMEPYAISTSETSEAGMTRTSQFSAPAEFVILLTINADGIRPRPKEKRVARGSLLNTC